MKIDVIKSAKAASRSSLPTLSESASLPQIAEYSDLALRKAVSEARKIVEASARASGGFVKFGEQGSHGDDLLEEAVFLEFGLRKTMDMIYRDECRVKIPGVGGGTVKSKCRNLCSAGEAISALNKLINQVAEEFATIIPDSDSCHRVAAARAYVTITEWDRAASTNEYELLKCKVARTVGSSLLNHGRVNFVMFVCPRAEFGFLASDEPELYLQTSLAESIVSRQASDLRALFRGIGQVGVDCRVSVIIGDTDEDDYLWPVIGSPPGLASSRLNERREQLLQSSRLYFSESVRKGAAQESAPRIVSVEQLNVISVSQCKFSAHARECGEQIVRAPEKFFEQAEIEGEVIRFQELWRPGKYYSELERPTEEGWRRIVARFFASYAMQGISLYETNRDAVLIQTEKPALLRTKMLNAGRRALGLPDLASIYLYEPEGKSGA